jgi:acetyl-CoA synthetase
MEYKYPVFSRQDGKKPLINEAEYKSLYQQSVANPDVFWGQQAEKFLSWDKKWSKVSDCDFNPKKPEDLKVEWFAGAKLNVSYNCIDRHLSARANQTAIIWEGDSPEVSKNISYQELHLQVCKFANVLKNLGVKKGDVVTIYMPMILEAAYAMLACTRIGAVHSVVFGGFSPEALRGRIEDGNSKIIITADEGVRGGKTIPLKNNVDDAIKLLAPEFADIKTLVVKHTGGKINFANNNFWYHDEFAKADSNCQPEIMDAESPLFILYTSGSTGKPKGIMHTTAGYLLYAAVTHKYTFDYQEGDIYWCTADVGWITGHSYILYGPLANGATTLMFEGMPTYPTAARCWEVVDKHKVNIFYTAPTAIRSLMALGEEFVKQTSRKTLRILGSVGEPINPEAWRWYYENVGDEKCPIVDTWWQTETGGFLITPLPYATPLKAGSASLPFFGVVPVVVDTENNILDGEASGNLCIQTSWPGQSRSIWGDHKRFYETYFAPFKGRYFSGDGVKRDADGYYWITGRVDDVINVSGHRIGTAEVESALVSHLSVAEAAVVGFPHDIKGQGIYAYVKLKNNVEATDDLCKQLFDQARKEIGAIAKPDFIQFAADLPRTRSGKIMRRILRKIACNDYSDLGDTKTLLNPDAVEKLIEGRLNR